MAALLNALALKDKAEIERQLARASASDVNFQDESGRTPLHLACNLANAQSAGVIETLVARGAHLDVANKHGTTPLQKAVLANNSAAALTLIRKGADVGITNSKGLTAVELARTDAGAVPGASWICFKRYAKLNNMKHF